MIKYDLMKSRVEVRNKNRLLIAPGCTYDFEGDIDSELIRQFDTKEDAIASLGECRTHIFKSGTLYIVDEYYIQKNEYDEDGDLECTLDICEVSKMEIEVVSDIDLSTLNTFDNLNDAEEFYNDCIQNNLEVHIRNNQRRL